MPSVSVGERCGLNLAGRKRTAAKLLDY